MWRALAAMAPGSVAAAAMAAALLLPASSAWAHHSYADYRRDERFTLHGIVSTVHWGNPHILLTVDHDGQPVLVEWVTTAGADKTGVARERFVPGDRITVIGSRHRDPDVHRMTLVRELHLPGAGWQWVSPAANSRWQAGPPPSSRVLPTPAGQKKLQKNRWPYGRSGSY